MSGFYFFYIGVLVIKLNVKVCSVIKNDLYMPLTWEENNLSAHFLSHNMLGLVWSEKTLGSLDESMIGRVLIWKFFLYLEL